MSDTLKPYAGRYTDPVDIERHRRRSLLWGQMRLAEGRCVRCGAPHERPGRTPGSRARCCEPCAEKVRVYGRAYAAARTSEKKARRAR